ncbi:MAG: T9SS type A sorting domain-containing protein, partial [Bacteroidia bacterium]|nr:T9SS type A sorting domain-containing protein [Bacteroidia bacterium]
VSVYPNPSNTGSVTVKSSEIVGEVKLFNITGQLILTETAINKTECTINTEKMPKGNYILLVTFKNGFTERKNLNIE